MLISNSQGVSTNGGSSTGNGNNPDDARDSMPAPLWRYLSSMQVR